MASHRRFNSTLSPFFQAKREREPSLSSDDLSSDTDDDDDDSDVDVDGIDDDAANLAASLENKVHSGVAFKSITTTSVSLLSSYLHLSIAL